MEYHYLGKSGFTIITRACRAAPTGAPVGAARHRTT